MSNIFPLSNHNKCVFTFVVCFDIQLNIKGETLYEKTSRLKNNSTVRWKLGACSSLNSIEAGSTYQYSALYTERCCLDSGRYTLVCYNSPPAKGWNNAHILINGHQYCDDFVTYESFQKIYVTGSGMNISYLFYNKTYDLSHAWKTICSSLVCIGRPCYQTNHFIHNIIY